MGYQQRNLISLNNKNTFWFFAISLHAFAFIWQCWGTPAFTKDSYEYLNAAKNLAFYAGDQLSEFNPYLSTKRTPGYPVFLWILGAVPFLIFLIQNLLSLLNIWLLNRLQVQKLGKINYGLLLLLLILSPAQIIYANLVMAEMLLQTVVLGIFYLLLQNKKSTVGWVSLLISLAFLIKPICFLWVFLWPVFVLVKYRKELSLKIGLLSLTPLAVFGLLGYVNYTKTDVFHLSSQAGINKFHYNAYGVLLTKNNAQKADSIMDTYLLRIKSQLDFKTQYTLQNKIADSIILANPVAYAKTHLKGCAACLFDPGRFDVAVFLQLKNNDYSGFYYAIAQNGFKELMEVISKKGPAMVLFLIIMIVGACWKWWRMLVYFVRSNDELFAKILVLFLLGYFVFLAGPVGSSRFLVPIYPVIFYGILASGFKGLKKHKNA